jgi:hypothetical protein
MKTCKVSEHGYFLQKSIRQYTGGIMLTAEQMAWAKFLTVDFDGCVYVWGAQPELWHENHKLAGNPFNEVAYTGRWVQPNETQDALCEPILKLHTYIEEFNECIFKLQYEDDNNENTKFPPETDVSGLVASVCCPPGDNHTPA